MAKQSKQTALMCASRYNFHVPTNHGDLLYNASTGSVLKLSGPDAADICLHLCRLDTAYNVSHLPESLRGPLTDGGFLLPPETDELAEIRQRYSEARHATPLVVTITTTMECNLGCYYCYETRTGDRLESPEIAELEHWVEERLRARTDRALHVDWYGGEPLLNLPFIESASQRLQKLCERESARYSASVISNGTMWPEDLASFISDHKIRQVQISFDGLRDNHDSRRRYRRGHSPYEGASSFEIAARLVDLLLDLVRVDIRINIDRRNQDDLQQFVDMAATRGWLSRKYPAVIQPARLASYSDRSAFMGSYQLTVVELDTLKEKLRNRLDPSVRIEESEAPDGFPSPRTSVCAALATDSFVAGADGLHYRCGLQVGEKHRAVGVWSEKPQSAAFGEFPDARWWSEFDPTTQPTCSRCSFLPICWGGCPKKHLEGDRHALDEQAVYWRKNLPRLVATRFGAKPIPGFNYSEADQFREDHPKAENSHATHHHP